MSWIIKIDQHHYLYGVDNSEWAMLTTDQTAAKRFETKPDAKAFNDKYDLNGHIIPA